MNLEAIALMLTGIPLLIIQMVYFLLDDRAENHTGLDLKYKKYWHAAAGGIHIWMGYVVGRIAGDWHAGLLMSALMWFFFDGAINTWVLKKEWFYIGTTAQLDIAQRWAADKIGFDDPRMFSAFLKMSLLFISIIDLVKGLI
jgi:hypothetical protein